MCLGIPGQVVQMLDGYGGHLALVDVAGKARKVNVGMLPDETFAPGDWVIIHMGFVVDKTDKAGADEAMAGLELLGRAATNRLPTGLRLAVAMSDLLLKSRRRSAAVHRDRRRSRRWLSPVRAPDRQRVGAGRIRRQRFRCGVPRGAGTGNTCQRVRSSPLCRSAAAGPNQRRIRRRHRHQHRRRRGFPDRGKSAGRRSHHGDSTRHRGVRRLPRRTVQPSTTAVTGTRS